MEHIRRATRVGDIMTLYPKTISQDDTLVHARDLMVWGDFRHLVVVDAKRDVVGVLSERDVADYQASMGESIYSNPTDKVAVAMARSPVTAHPSEELEQVARRMAERKIGCLPVLADGALLGIVTTTDILAVSAKAGTSRRERPAVLAGGAMSPNPHTACREDDLLEAATKMQEYQVRHLPVVDGDKRVVGMLSDRDVRSAFGDLLDMANRSPAKTIAPPLRVGDWMSTPVIKVEAHRDCVELAWLMASRYAGALPVVDGDERLIGILSYVDVLRALAETVDRESGSKPS